MSTIKVDTIEDSSGSQSISATRVINGSAKAWVNFNAVPLNGTYSLPNFSSTVTVTMTAHALAPGMIVTLDITSGTFNDGYFTVLSTPTANTFTFDAGFVENGGGKSGNVTKQAHIRAAYNVTHISDNGVGEHTINFITPMSNPYYVAVGNAGRPNNTGSAGTEYMVSPRVGVPKTVNALAISVAYADTVEADADDVSVVIFGA